MVQYLTSVVTHIFILLILLSWREGVVKEKSQNDETTLTIDIPGMHDLIEWKSTAYQLLFQTQF